MRLARSVAVLGGMVLLLASTVLAGQAPTPPCHRECLRGLLDAYVSAMVRHDASALHVLPTVKFTENGAVMKLGEGFWKTAGAMTWHLDALDPEGAAAAREAVMREGGGLVTFLLRIKVQGNALAEVETLVGRKGHADPFAPEKLTTPSPVFATPVAPANRASRQQLRDAADAYFTAVQTEGTPGYRPAPLAADANRFENGEQTTNVAVFGLPAASAPDQLARGFFKGLTISKRRFPVIDTENGVVLGIALMTGSGFEGVLFAEMYKVTAGKLREIRAVIVNHAPTAPTGWE
jgi:hypothetical protein